MAPGRRAAGAARRVLRPRGTPRRGAGAAPVSSLMLKTSASELTAQ